MPDYGGLAYMGQKTSAKIEDDREEDRLGMLRRVRVLYATRKEEVLSDYAFRALLNEAAELGPMAPRRLLVKGDLHLVSALETTCGGCEHYAETPCIEECCPSHCTLFHKKFRGVAGDGRLPECLEAEKAAESK